MMNVVIVEQTPSLMTALVLALSRATIAPFTHAQRSEFADATPGACSVSFRPADHRDLLRLLRVGHWDPECVLVVLDDTGLTWNGWAKTNSYAWQVRLQLVEDIWDGGTPADYAEVTPGMEPVTQHKMRTWVWSAHGVWHAVVLVKPLDNRMYHNRPAESQLLTVLRDVYGHDALELVYGPPPEGVVQLDAPQSA